MITRLEKSTGSVVSECDRKASITGSAWPTGAVTPWGEGVNTWDSLLSGRTENRGSRPGTD